MNGRVFEVGELKEVGELLMIRVGREEEVEGEGMGRRGFRVGSRVRIREESLMLWLSEDCLCKFEGNGVRCRVGWVV